MELVDPYTLISFVKENDAQYCWKQRCYWCYRWHVPFWMTQTQPPIACRRTRALGMILSCLHCQITWHQRERERSAGTWWNHGEPTNSNLTRTKWKIEWELYWNYRNILSLLHTEFFLPTTGVVEIVAIVTLFVAWIPARLKKRLSAELGPSQVMGDAEDSAYFCLVHLFGNVWSLVIWMWPPELDHAMFPELKCFVQTCSNHFKPKAPIIQIDRASFKGIHK
jgi:hypothetical protein